MVAQRCCTALLCLLTLDAQDLGSVHSDAACAHIMQLLVGSEIHHQTGAMHAVQLTRKCTHDLHVMISHLACLQQHLKVTKRQLQEPSCHPAALRASAVLYSSSLV